MNDQQYEKLLTAVTQTAAKVDAINEKLEDGKDKMNKHDTRINSLEHSRTRLRTGMAVSWTLLGGALVATFKEIFRG